MLFKPLPFIMQSLITNIACNVPVTIKQTPYFSVPYFF